MYYEVTIDFHDRAVQAPHICKSETELALYLERIPGMVGFELFGGADIRVRKVDRPEFRLHYTHSGRHDDQMTFHRPSPPALTHFELGPDGSIKENFPHITRGTNRP